MNYESIVAGFVAITIALFDTVALLGGPIAPLIPFGDSLRPLRENSAFQFSATDKYAVFPAPLSKDTVGLVLLDRSSSALTLLEQNQTTFSNAYLSRDGVHLYYVKSAAASRVHDLIKCKLATGECKELLSLERTIFSPTEVAPGKILFSSSGFAVGVDGKTRAAQHDFFLLEEGREPKQLTNFALYQLDSISESNGRLLFQAYPSPNSAAFAKRDVITPDSEIYELSFDLANSAIATPANKLEPLRPASGYLTNPSLSEDGSRIGFLRRRNPKGEYHFDLVYSSRAGGPRIIDTNGPSFSRPAFVSDEVLANELTSHEYRITAFDVHNGARQVLKRIAVNPRALAKLERAKFQFKQ